MLKKLLAFLSIAAVTAVTAQDRIGLLEIQAPKVTVGTYWERMDYDGRHLDDYHWGTAYLKVGLQTGEWQGLSIGAELLAHGEVYDSDDDRYDVDIEPQDKVSLSRFFLQYKVNNLLVRAGRIGRKIDGFDVHLDDNTYEGLMAKFTVNKDLTFVAGAITSFGEKDYDDAEDLTDVHNFNNGDASDAVFFAEAFANAGSVYTVNPYAFHHDEFANVVGVDNWVTLGDADSLTYGIEANALAIDSKLAQVDDSFNVEASVFVKTKLNDALLKLQAGQIKYDGNGGGDPAMLQPFWFQDYFGNCDQDLCRSDQTQWLHSNDLQDGIVNYVKAKYEKTMFGRPCWASAYLGRTDYEDELNRNTHVELRELWFGCDFTKKLTFFIKFIDSEHKDHQFDYQRIETRIQYTF